METSFISAKTLNDLGTDRNKKLNETAMFDVKSLGSKKRGDTPERKLKES